MKSQLVSVFVMATVACGGSGGEEPRGPVEGTTDVAQSGVPRTAVPRTAVPRTEARVPAEAQVDAPQPTEVPILVADPIAAPHVSEAPIPVERGRVSTADPVPVAGTQPTDAQWQARAPQRYVISTCGTGFGIPSCSVVAVDEGRVVSRSNRFLPDEPWASAPIEDSQEPVASLFEQARQSIDGCTTSFQLDAVYAYPSQVYFDCGEEGWGVRVSCFEADTLDVSRCQ